MEWIACTGYASVSTFVPAGQNLVLPLMTMPDYTTVDPSALESDEWGDFMLRRIVGQVNLVVPADELTGDAFLWGWRLQPLPYDPSTAAFDVPWAVNDSPLRSVDISNQPRWWGERFCEERAPVQGSFVGLTTLDHPHWTHVDLSPNYLCGPHSGLEYPALVVDNTPNPDRIIIHRRLRLLVEPRR